MLVSQVGEVCYSFRPDFGCTLIATAAREAVRRSNERPNGVTSHKLNGTNPHPIHAWWLIVRAPLELPYNLFSSERKQVNWKRLSIVGFSPTRS